jgi:hypothetical protein
LALALSAEAYRIFAFIVLAKAAPEAATCPPPEGGGNLNSRRSDFDTSSKGRGKTACHPDSTYTSEANRDLNRSTHPANIV